MGFYTVKDENSRNSRDWNLLRKTRQWLVQKDSWQKIMIDRSVNWHERMIDHSDRSKIMINHSDRSKIMVYQSDRSHEVSRWFIKMIDPTKCCIRTMILLMYVRKGPLNGLPWKHIMKRIQCYSISYTHTCASNTMWPLCYSIVSDTELCARIFRSGIDKLVMNCSKNCLI